MATQSFMRMEFTVGSCALLWVENELHDQDSAVKTHTISTHKLEHHTKVTTVAKVHVRTTMNSLQQTCR